jgi:uncharacterized protein YceK
MKWNHLAALAAIVVVSALSGCASVQKADQGASTRAKVFAPLTDKGVVYVYRDELLGAAIKMPVKVDDLVAGQTYYVWQEVKMGLMSARSALHVVSADVGKAGVRKCDLLQTEAAALRMPAAP